MEKLSESEEIVMRCLWDSESPAGLGEIIDMCRDNYGHDWKPQTVSTFISRLIKKGFAGHIGSTRSHRYYPLIDRDAYLNDQMRSMIDFWGKPSIRALASAFGRSKALNREDLQELRDMLDQLDE